MRQRDLVELFHAADTGRSQTARNNTREKDKRRSDVAEQFKTFVADESRCHHQQAAPDTGDHRLGDKSGIGKHGVDRGAKKAALIAKPTQFNDCCQHSDDVITKDAKGLAHQHCNTDTGFGANIAQQAAKHRQNCITDQTSGNDLRQRKLADETCSNVNRTEANDAADQNHCQ